MLGWVELEMELGGSKAASIVLCYKYMARRECFSLGDRKWLVHILQIHCG